MILPHVPNSLIDYFADAYPLRNPTLSMLDREIWIEAGKQELIDDLRAIHKAQQEGGDDTEGLPNVLSVRPGAAGSTAAAASDTSSPSATAARSSGSAGNRLGS